MDITEAILADHNEQRRLFAILEQIGPDEAEALAAVWHRLRILLEVHAEAEEKHFYPRLLDVGSGANDAPSAEEETKDAIRDHNEIRDACADVDRHEPGSKPWFAAVAKANKANSEHMAEEERQALADFRQHASIQVRHDLTLRFLTFKFRHLDGVAARDEDPDEYLAKHGAVADA